jgi:hypothetical protein
VVAVRLAMGLEEMVVGRVVGLLQIMYLLLVVKQYHHKPHCLLLV